MKKIFILMLMTCIGLAFSNYANGQKKNPLEGYEWLEGRWVTQDLDNDFMYHCIIITKDFCQHTSYNEDDGIITDLKQKPKKTYTIEIESNPYIGDTKIITGTGYYIDEAKKQLFFIYDFDQKMYMKKIK